jgi:hypothetical protein
MIRKTALLFAVTTVLTLTTAARTPQPQKQTWTTYTSAKAKFSVLTPCEFVVTSESMKLSAGDLEQIFHGCRGIAGYYTVAFSEFPTMPPANGSKAMLDNFRNGIVEGTKSKLLSEKQITLGTNPGREFTVVQGSGAQELLFKWRAYLVGKRVYGLGVGSSRSNAASPDVDKFLTSFKPQ